MSKKHSRRLVSHNEKITAGNHKEAEKISQEEPNCEDQHNASSTGCLLRIFWMLVGNVVLTFCVLGIAQHRGSILSIADACFCVIVGFLLATRYFDIRHCGGTTTDGEPATLVHWRHYAMILGVVSMVLWIGAHIAAYYGT